MALMYILSFLIIKSHSISLDYYAIKDNIEAKKSDYYNNVKDARRSNNNNSLTENYSYQIERFGDSNSNKDEFDEYNIKISQDKHKTITSGKSHQAALRNETNNTVLNLREKNNNAISEKTPSLSLFNEYEYAYDDTSVQPHNLLRNHLSNHNEINMTLAKNNFDNHTTTSKYSNTMRYMTSFYNSEPSVGRVNIKKLVAAGNTVNNTVWYVLEKYPCWDLPSLYAELGQKRKTEDVFVLSSGNLKNVIHEGIENVSLPSSIKVPYHNIANKWCATRPCYGDHTLCIFDKRISNICDKGYKVIVPTLLEQKALVNTINSMRNRIANGMTERYKHLPTAANIKQVLYDLDLEKIARVWLSQCLPGPAPCSSLGDSYVSQLECTKYAEYCCVASYRRDHIPNCIPLPECYVPAIIGCIHKWFWSAGQKLTEVDIGCGHSSPSTYNTVQLLWAETRKIGCACGKRHNGDIRVVCNFAPGAPFYIETELYCGLIAHKDITDRFDIERNVTNDVILSHLGINETLKLDKDTSGVYYIQPFQGYDETITVKSDLDNLNNIYNRGWLRKMLGSNTNGTKGIIARLVSKYTFYEQDKCNNEDSVYIIGKPGSLCVERGKRFEGLCYDFSDLTPIYRLVAIIAPAALFSLILYDLFSGVIRQTNY